MYIQVISRHLLPLAHRPPNSSLREENGCKFIERTLLILRGGRWCKQDCSTSRCFDNSNHLHKHMLNNKQVFPFTASTHLMLSSKHYAQTVRSTLKPAASTVISRFPALCLLLPVRYCAGPTGSLLTRKMTSSGLLLLRQSKRTGWSQFKLIPPEPSAKILKTKLRTFVLKHILMRQKIGFFQELFKGLTETQIIVG